MSSQRAWRLGDRPLGSGWLLLLCACSGCGHSDVRVPVYPVLGKLLFEGQPAAGALVTFHPAGKGDPSLSRPRGYVQADGTFQLTTYDNNDGGPAGQYVVTIDWRKGASEGEGEEGENLLPEAFSLASQSTLRAEIKQGDSNHPAFNLKEWP